MKKWIAIGLAAIVALVAAIVPSYDSNQDAVQELENQIAELQDDIYEPEAPGRRIVRSTIASRIRLAGPATRTIASGNITVGSNSFYVVGAQGIGNSTDDLENINGGNRGQVVVLMALLGNETIVLKDDLGNLSLSSDFSLDAGNDTITLIYDGSIWLEISEADNS